MIKDESSEWEIHGLHQLSYVFDFLSRSEHCFFLDFSTRFLHLFIVLSARRSLSLNLVARLQNAFMN